MKKNPQPTLIDILEEHVKVNQKLQQMLKTQA